jgi:hypothetical protein
MTPEEQNAKMTKAINLAIKVLGNRFGSTEGDVARALEELKAALPTSTKPVATPAPVATAAED